MAPRVVKEPDVRRHELLEAAMRLFIQQGYDDTSVQAITDAASVAKGTFYHYFTSKEDLLDQLVSWQADVLFEAVEARSREIEGRPLEEIRELVGMILDWKYEDARELTYTYMRLFYRPENLSMRVKLMNQSMKRFHPLLLELVEEGVVLGVFHVMDVEAATDIIVAIYRGTGEELVDLILSAAEHPENVDRVIAHLRAIENAVERILGIEEGTLRLYDHDRLRESFAQMAASLGGAR